MTTANNERRRRPYELAEAIDRVQVAAKKLRSNHFSWMVDSAIRVYTEQVRCAEVEIMRHEHFANEPHHDVIADHSRRSELTDARTHLDQKRDILAFLIAVHDLLSIQAAEDFAKGFRQSFGSLFAPKATVKR